jgi:hypothetical protein
MSVATDRLENTTIYDRARTDLYALLAVLLIQPPSAKVLAGVRNLAVAESLPQRLHAALILVRARS